MNLRVGTRGSELALAQTREVCRRLAALRPEVTCEEIVIRTRGDVEPGPLRGVEGVVGYFTTALEEALLAGEVDFAVHSHKDLPAVETEGLAIAAIPPRASAHDVLVLREASSIAELPPGARIGTSSPRRAAQWRREGPFAILPLRGNVPTRLEQLAAGQFDAIVLAAAGLERLERWPAQVVHLPVERFVPAPAQGALAIQTRRDHPALELLRLLDDAGARRTVTAERSFLRAIGPGCHTPVGALAVLVGEQIRLHGQLFSEDGQRVAEGEPTGADPEALGKTLAAQLREALGP
jgi:hydroxymethylbilane synthase